MAVYSLIGGEETGGAALLAASALAFGLLALSLDRSFIGSSRTGQQDRVVGVEAASANGRERLRSDGRRRRGARYRCGNL